MNNTFTVNDAHDIITKKILIGKLSKSALEKQIQYSNAVIKLQTITSNIATQKKERINILENLFEQQLTNFTAERQQECMDIYISINKLDMTTIEQRNIIILLESLDCEMKKLYEQIETLEKTIPIDKLITQYNISTLSQTNQSNQSSQTNRTKQV